MGRPIEIAVRTTLWILAVAGTLPGQEAEPSPSRGVREFRQLARYLSMDWVAEGRLQSPADPAAAGAAVLRMPLTDASLQWAARRRAALSIVYANGMDLYGGRPATIDDIPALAKAFYAGLTDDEDGKAETVATVLREVVVTNARIRTGSELVAAAAREHAAVWRSLAKLVEESAGPATEEAPLAVAVIVGDERTTGLQFRNRTGAALHHVVLAVDSTLATPEQGNVATHTVFVPTWGPERAVLLPPRLMLGAKSGASGDVTYRVWAAELRSQQTTPFAPETKEASRARAGEPRVRPLGDRPAAKAPVAPKVAPGDATLDEATTFLEQPDLGKAQAAFESLEAKLGSPVAAADESRQTTLSVVKFRLAETLRLRGFAAARADSDDEKAKDVLVRANRKYAEVLEAPDVETPREGRSLHAAALRHMVHVDAILCEGYRALAKKRPKEKTPPRRAEAHAAAVKKNLLLLEERHPNACDAEGRSHLEAARDLVRQLMTR